MACYTASVLLTDGNANSMQEVLFADQLTRTDNAYRRLLLNAIPALTLNVMCDKRPGQMYVRHYNSSQLSSLYKDETTQKLRQE